MPSRTFTKEQLQAMACDEEGPLEQVHEEILETGRWSILYEAVFKAEDDGKHYRTHYRRGATEMQDESPYEYASASELVCEEVELREVKVEKWVATAGKGGQ